MIEIKFPAENKAFAAALGAALTEYAGGAVTIPAALTEYAGGAVTIPAEVVETTEAPKPTAPSAAEPTGSGETSAPAAGASSEVDQNGVPHNPTMCVGLRASKPFYATGKNAGGWKKGKGVDEGEFEAWYAAERAKVQPEPEQETQPANTAAAFGAVEPPPQQEDTPAAPAKFDNAGHFMQWLAEAQAAGRVTQTEVEHAYADTGVQVPELFNPATADDAIAKVYSHLVENVATL